MTSRRQQGILGFMRSIHEWLFVRSFMRSCWVPNVSARVWRGGWALLIVGAGLAFGFTAAARKMDEPEARPNISLPPVENSLTNGLGSWIWESKTFNNQPCQLWRSFEIPRDTHVTHGVLRITVDHKFTVLLDGVELGSGDRVNELYEFEVTSLLAPGEHVLAIHGYNASGTAGAICALEAELAGGQKIEIQSDRTWRVVPVSVHGWERMSKASNSWAAATIIAPLGNGPWWQQSNTLKLVIRTTSQNSSDSGWNGFVAGISADNDLTNGLGSWIWTSKTFDDQSCQFWKYFDIPSSTSIRYAELRMTVDNAYTVYLDGRKLGRGADWRELFEYDLTALLAPGRHILAVDAFNSSAEAGMILGLRIDLADGRRMDVKSDASWRIVPEGARNWESATSPSADWQPASIIAPLGDAPWWSNPSNVNWMPAIEPAENYFWQTGWFQVALLSLLALVTLISVHQVAQRAMDRKEQWLQRRERARIARDIHDDLGSRMTSLVLHGEIARSELPPGSETRQRVENICEEARRMLSTLDEILWAVNPKRDSLRDFVSYVCGYAQEFLSPTGIQCFFDMDFDAKDIVLDLPLKRTLLMVIKEALNNAVKHSQATELVLKIKWQSQQLVVAASDNGKGFDQASIKQSRDGLANMAQRANELGGTFVITSEPGKGCRTEFNIPLRQSRRGGWNWVPKFNPSASHRDETEKV